MSLAAGVLSGLNPVVVVGVVLMWKLWTSSKFLPRGCRVNPEVGDRACAENCAKPGWRCCFMSYVYIYKYFFWCFLSIEVALQGCVLVGYVYSGGTRMSTGVRPQPDWVSGYPRVCALLCRVYTLWVPGYLPECDQNNQVRYPGTPAYVPY